MTYTLRVPVRTLGKQPLTAVETADPIVLDGVEVILASTPPFLVATAAGFPTEDAAVSFVPRVVTAFWSLVVCWNVAYTADFTPQPITYADDPLAAAENLATSLGLENAGPVHGIVEADATVVYPSDKRLKFLAFGSATGTVTTPASLALPAFRRGLSLSNATMLTADEDLRTAMDLYVGHFYETSLRARFLTLVMVMEVLAPVTDKHLAAQALIQRWQQELQRELANTSDADALHALDSLSRELEFRKETSIRQRVRALVRNAFLHLDSSERELLERDAVSAYDTRGGLVHEGTLTPADLTAALDKASRIVRKLLSTRLGISEASTEA